MEAIEEVPLGSKEPSQIIKGKRTKRIRPQSPPPVSITANSSTAEGGNGDCYNNHKDKYDINSSSPATSVAVFEDSTEEDEDMANCLILLAQGPSRKDIALVEDEDGGTNYAKYSSRKFMEAAALGSGKAGYYVYECKTCNRTFPSFQALGGHRASHKKLKTVAMDNEEEFQFKNKIVNNHNNNPFSLQLNSRGNLQINKNSKVHECSICGAEFTSGQALGGHMRRHRVPVAANTTLSLTPLMALEAEEEQARKRRNIVSLDLDLNLPAPEDDQRESKFGFTSKQQQQQEQQQQQQQPKQPQQHANLVFSASSLVDCHY